MKKIMPFEDYTTNKKMDNLKNAVYTNNISQEHLKRIKGKNKKYLETDRIKSKSPENLDPVELSNSFLAIKSAIETVGIKTAREEAKRYDHGMIKKFQRLVRSIGGDIDRETLKEIKDEAGDFILKEKYRWNIPRPYQVSEILGIPFSERYKTDSSNSPSYPSGHSFQSHIIAEYLSSIYPEGRKYFKNLANMISNSRVLAGVHFKEDIEEGKRLAEVIASNKGIKTKNS